MGRIDKKANEEARAAREAELAALEDGEEELDDADFDDDEEFLSRREKRRAEKEAEEEAALAEEEAAATESKPRGKVFWGSIAVLLAIAYLGANFLDVWWASRQSYDETASAAVVLGAAQYNGEPSPALRGRLDTAAELYAADKVDYIVVTGGGREGDATTQAKASYDYLRSTAGIPDERLFLEVEGTSTYEELAASSRFLVREGLTDVILVTDPYHAKRAALVAEEVGLTAEVHPTDSGAPFDRLAQETLAVSAGRVLTFRRLEQVISE